MNTIDAINDAEKRLAEAGIETPRLDAEVLLARVLNSTRAELYASDNDAVPAELLELFDRTISERANGCPVAYLTGQKEFWSLPIKVTPNVMIPRPDTETLIEEVLRIVPSRSQELRLLDLCTGSGCIAAALATELPNARFTITDISQEALDIAYSNLLFAKDRVAFRKGNLFEALAPHQTRFDMIVTNPPYIPETDRETLPCSIVNYEPRGAIFGGKTGLDFISRIIEDASLFLNTRGWLIMEVGLGQAPTCVDMALATEAYDTIKTAKDLSGIERVVSMRKNTDPGS